MINQRGFSLIEMGIATACALLLVLGASTMATQAMKHHQHAAGKLDSIQQNSEIKDLIFNLAGANPSSCMSRLGLNSSSPTFAPGTEYLLPTSALPNAGSGVTVQKLYLSAQPGAQSMLTNNGVNRVYSTQLKIEQKLNRGVASALKPIALGVMNVTVDSSNKIVGCGWDDSSTSPMQHCSSTSGAVAAGAGCFMEPEIEVITTCPTGTSLTSGRCVASNVNCYNQALGKQFDGYRMNCNLIPNTYAVRYPSNYTPPSAASPTSAGDSISTPSCTCGNQTIPAGSNQLCIKGWSQSEYFGNYDDMWHVRRCNSVGQLEGNSPNEYVFYEEGHGINHSYRIGSCSFTSDSVNIDGRRYTVGVCQ